ncbi:histidine kinase dimerization/phosphoacceptor domain -containing protein [Moheibacter sediminis]|uniref:histidine kinase n=1 Tax=Moheibacter sediminis TaxID=1434700 RepID=A0A1W2AQZ4_9FLAO|nr:histidine kinase dimerization/phosphoacceptor domain -containing protein [Moheibacter sediminis]SMC62861.1 Two-component sensor histidine kinase, contains HisKA and HATPase domains [Moheibacter sediminis]
MKCVFLLFVLILGHFTMAQDFDAEYEINKIDSLILYNQSDIAQIKTNELSQKFQSEKNNKEVLLEIQFRQAVILDRKDESSVEPLQILLEIKDKAEKENLHSLMYRIDLMIALAYEKSEHWDLTKKYLDNAYNLYKNHQLNNLYSTYCIRKSSYCRYVNQWDSSFYYAKQAKKYAEKNHNETDLRDSYILLGNFASKDKNYPEALKYNFLMLDYSKKYNDYSIAVSYNNISKIYFKMNNYSKALSYNDSVFIFYKQQALMYKPYFSETRYKIFEALGKTDSAYHYFKQYHNDFEAMQKEEELLKTKELEEKYQNSKKEAVIKNKNQQMILIGSFLGVIIFGSVMLYLKNRKINKQNKIIGKQLAELSKTLEQKQMLLSELQHRVKNNLQHVISILEIQKESVDFNNIDELLRSNQNRIHSMALLHKKLNVTDNANEVDFRKYIAELAELVKDSYDNHNKKISLNIKCEIETISLEKALPLGLIITELVSNSMKHAFKKQNIGIINIEITKNETGKQLYYSDNGSGFDFNKVNEKGLGQEIIKGLIDQLDGSTQAKSNNGFELTIFIK